MINLKLLPFGVPFTPKGYKVLPQKLFPRKDNPGKDKETYSEMASPEKPFSEKPFPYPEKILPLYEGIRRASPGTPKGYYPYTPEGYWVLASPLYPYTPEGYWEKLLVSLRIGVVSFRGTGRLFSKGYSFRDFLREKSPFEKLLVSRKDKRSSSGYRILPLHPEKILPRKDTTPIPRRGTLYYPYTPKGYSILPLYPGGVLGTGRSFSGY